MEMSQAYIIVASVFAAAIIMAAAALGATRGDAEVAVKAIDSMARQPEQTSTFQINMLIAIGLVESIPIIASVIAIVLVMANPFVK